MLQEFTKSGTWKIYGGLDPEILIAGHSHTFAMFMALQQNNKFQGAIGLVSHANFDKQLRPDNEYWDFIVEQSEGKNLAISWNGNEHNLHFLIDTKMKFNSLGLNLGSKYPYITISRIKESFRSTFYQLELILSRFPDRSKICLLGTPPPKPQTQLNKKIQLDHFFLELGEKIGIQKNEIKVSSNELRTFMWKITQELNEKSAKEFGCKYLPAPSESFDSDFLLREIYCEDDLTHANPEYGLLMLEKISEFFGVSVEQ
jgi:hypothetical protein